MKISKHTSANDIQIHQTGLLDGTACRGRGGGGHSETEKIVLPIKPKRLTEDLFQLDSHIGFSFLYFHPKHSLLVNMH